MSILQARFNLVVLGGWWLTLGALGGLRLWHGDGLDAIMLLASAMLTALLAVGLSIDNARSDPDDGPDAEVGRLRKATLLFSIIAIATVIGYAAIHRAFAWAALECGALVWVLPAFAFPMARGFLRSRAHARAS